jgi:parallel beta-helix repeat protein
MIIFSINLVYLTNLNNIILNEIIREDKAPITPMDSGFWDLTGSPILIDDDGGTPGSRTWAQVNSTELWCSGSGTWSDPYIIENVTINALNNDTAIWIIDSNVYFTLHNNTLSNSGTGLNASIRVDNSTNGQLIDNYATGNNGVGIYLENTDNFTIFGNTANNNADEGIFIQNTNNSILRDNNANYNVNEFGIKMSSSHNNQIINNTAHHNDAFTKGGFTVSNSNNNNFTQNNISVNDGYGIDIGGSDNNTILANTLNDNTYSCLEVSFSDNNKILNNIAKGSTSDNGIYLNVANNNTISGNNASSNLNTGILLGVGDDNNVTNNIAGSNNYGIVIMSDNSIIKNNLIKANNLGLDLVGSNNDIYNNTLINNNDNADDDGTNNNWDNGSSGNWWHDYTGVDSDKNGKGDTPYNISGTASSQDRYPIGWFNDTTYLKVFNYTSMAYYSANQTSEFWPNTINLTVGYYSPGGLIKDANLSYVWAFGTENITQDPIKAEGYYTFEINTSDVSSLGQYTIQISADHVNYTSANLDFQLDILGLPTNLTTNTPPINIFWNENFTARIFYNDTLNNLGINSSQVNYSIIEMPVISGVLNEEVIDGWYNLTLNSTILSQPGQYTLNITASKNFYDNQQLNITINLSVVPTNLTFSNYSISVDINDNLTLTAFFNDTFNDFGIKSAQVLYSVIEKPSISGNFTEELTDGFYNISFSAIVFSVAGTYTLNITAKKSNHETIQFNLTIQVTGQINQGNGKGNGDPDEDDYTFIIIIIIGIIGAVLGASIYTFRRSSRKKSPRMRELEKSSKSAIETSKVSKNRIISSIDNEILLKRFEQIISPENLTPLEGVKLTMISENFLNKIDNLNIKEKDKKELLTEMLALSPDERNKIVDKMLKKQKGDSIF